MDSFERKLLRTRTPSLSSINLHFDLYLASSIGCFLKFTIDSRSIARTGTNVKAGSVPGVVTSGNYSPILKKSIGFALFKNQPTTDLLEFDIRGKLVEGKIMKKRFLS